MAPYIDATYIGAFIPSNVLVSLFVDDGVADTGDAKRTAVIAAAQSVVDAALVSALEITVPLSDTVPEIVKQATLGQFALLAYGRKAIQVPEQFSIAIGLAEGIRSGKLSVPELAADTEAAIGGIIASETDESVEGSKPLNLSVSRLSSW